MEDLTFLLTVPGQLLMSLFAVAGMPDSDEVRADFAVSFGLVFWLVVLFIGYKTWRVVLPTSQRAGLKGWGIAHERWGIAHDKILIEGQRFGTLIRSTGWTWPQVWGATWRAELAHILVYAALPLFWEAARMALFILFLPFSVMSFHDQTGGWYDGTLDHLKRPVCWTFVTFCPGPYSHYLHTPVIDASKCWGGGNVPHGCPRGHERVRDTGGWYSKLAWVALALPWVILWHRRQVRRSRQTPPPTHRDNTNS